jgi:hypothetical protein
MDVQLNANVEDQDRAERGKNEAGGMILSGYRTRKHVGNRAADDRSDDAEHDFPPSFACRKLPSMAKAFTIDQTFRERERISSCRPEPARRRRLKTEE